MDNKEKETSNGMAPEMLDYSLIVRSGKLIRRGDDVYVRRPGGTWTELKDPSAEGVIVGAAVEARQEARNGKIAELVDIDNDGNEIYSGVANNLIPRSSSDYHWRQLVSFTRRVAFLDSGIEEAPESMGRPDSSIGKIIFTDQGGWDLVSNSYIEPDDLSGMYILSGQRSEFTRKTLHAAPSDTDVSLYSELLEPTFGPVLDRLAFNLIAPNKSVDVIHMSTKDIGKSSFTQLLERAMPGMVNVVSKPSVLSQKGMEYTTLGLYLTEYRLVLVEEPEKDQVVTADALKQITAHVIDVNEKKGPQYQRPRIGNTVLIGPAIPKFKTAEQGVLNRLNWVYSSETDRNMTPNERQRLMDSNVHLVLRRELLERMITIATIMKIDPESAMAITYNEKAKPGSEVLGTRVNMGAITTLDNIAENLFVEDDDAQETVAFVNALLKSRALRVDSTINTSKNACSKAMEEAFPTAKKDKINNIRVYIGIRHREDREGVDDEAEL